MRLGWLVAALLLVVGSALPAEAAPARVASVGFTFAPATVEIARGDTLDLVNLDVPVHNVTSLARTKKGALLFSSPTVGAGMTATVRGVPALKIGSYSYLCTVHPQMRGVLAVR